MVAGHEIDNGNCAARAAPGPERATPSSAAVSEIIGPAGSDMQMFPPTVASFQILNEGKKRPATLAEQRGRRPVRRGR